MATLINTSQSPLTNSVSKDVQDAYNVLKSGAAKTIRSAKEQKEGAPDMLAGLIKLSLIGEVSIDRMKGWCAGWFANGDGSKEKRTAVEEAMMELCGVTSDHFARSTADDVSDKSTRDAMNNVTRAKRMQFIRTVDQALPCALYLMRASKDVKCGRNASKQWFVSFPTRLIGEDNDMPAHFAPGSRVNKALVEKARAAVGVIKVKKEKGINRMEALNSIIKTFGDAAEGVSLNKLSVNERKVFYRALDAMLQTSNVSTDVANKVSEQIITRLADLDKAAPTEEKVAA